ncbi:MAG: hypothetical protein OXQ89_18195 [Rhodospirillaceae bacterium]|nr:hypothetical protein [Rhodospirillaceae bacterium]
MDRVRIRAREQVSNRREQPQEYLQQVTPAAPGEAGMQKFVHSITVRYSTNLYGTLHNMIESAHIAQDFTYLSPSDFVRAALRAYKNGMVLTEVSADGAKRETKLRVDDELYRFYQSLPKGIRSKLVERAIRTLIKNA